MDQLVTILLFNFICCVAVAAAAEDRRLKTRQDELERRVKRLEGRDAKQD